MDEDENIDDCGIYTKCIFNDYYSMILAEFREPLHLKSKYILISWKISKISKDKNQRR